jgi:polyisoprenoid-binding protein YceI
MKRFAPFLSFTILLACAALQSRAADTYKVDPVHSSAIFRIQHANIGYVWGRINDPAGGYTLDPADPTRSTFNVELQVNNVDTHNDKRDAHLKSPDFFNAKQFPTVTFKSTAVKKGASDKVLDVTGDLTLHGVTKSVTIPVELTGQGQFPPGTQRAGVEATFTIKRTDFGMDKMVGMVGDEVRLVIALEAVKQ